MFHVNYYSAEELSSDEEDSDDELDSDELDDADELDAEDEDFDDDLSEVFAIAAACVYVDKTFFKSASLMFTSALANSFPITA